MDIGGQTRFGTMLFHNNTGSTITQGQFAVLDPDDWENIQDADAIVQDQYGSPTNAFLPTVELLNATTDQQTIGGVAQHDIPDEQTGLFMVLGVTLADIHETVAVAAGDALMRGGANGRLSADVGTPGTTLVPVRGLASGQPSTTTTAGDQRIIMVHGLFGLEGDGADDPNPLGGVA